VEFSPVDQCVVSGSADTTIRIWSLKDQTCLKTLEGHVGSVLRVAFVSAGIQLVSAGADGLLKLWSIKTNECTNTFDAHEDKVWSLCVRGDGEQIVTGGGDSTINIWTDCTREVEEESIKSQEERILQVQQLSNCLQQNDYYRAAFIAFQLDHREKMLEILTKILQEQGQEQHQDRRGHSALTSLVSKFNEEQIGKCLLYIRDWNTIAKYSNIAQQFLNCILRLYSPKKLVAMSPGILDLPEVLQALIPYTDKHFSRVDRLIQRSFIVDYTIKSITNNVGGDEILEEPSTSDHDGDGNNDDGELTLKRKPFSGARDANPASGTRPSAIPTPKKKKAKTKT
jgi:U3 small nucleolar RNA-associated protein 13